MSKKTTNSDPRLDRVKQLSDFKKSIENATEAELKKIEQDVIKEADDVNKEVQETKFDLPEENYVDVAVAIQGLLGKVKVQWQYAAAMAEMYEFWNPEKKPSTVVCGFFYAPLCPPGPTEFPGISEWKAVRTVKSSF